MPALNRRSFLKTAGLAAVGTTLSPRSWAKVPGANEAIRVAVVGFGGRGGDHIDGVLKLAGQNVRLVALCDVDSKILDAGVAAMQKRGQSVTPYRDFRRLLDDPNIDAITIATPNHWHSLGVIWACQLGKDVYVEKPISHTVWEGRQAVEAARKYRRIVQAGTQSRSSTGIREAVQWVRAGNLGKITTARGLCYKARRSIGKVDRPQPIPPEIDYDLWCGPAPLGTLNRKRLHYDWHWIWDNGSGDLGNQGIHQMDIARWFLGVNELSPAVFSVGGRLGYIDDGETPNTQFVYHAYPNAPLIFEVRGLPRNKELQTDKGWNNGDMDRYLGAGIGVIIHCEGGHVVVPDYESATAHDKDGKQIKAWSGTEDHYANFFKAVRSRKVKDLNADILEGHLSSALCHTGNISYRLGLKSWPHDIKAALQSEPGAADTYARMAEHLAANGVDIDFDRLTLGPVLTMNPGKERFTRNSEADAMLRRSGRPPFVIPERV
jgi:predicted dehydrogenase